MVKLVHTFGLQDELLALPYLGNDMDLAVHSGSKAQLEFANGYVIEIIGGRLTYDGMAITGGSLKALVFRDPQGNVIANATDLKGFDAYFVYHTIVTQSGADLHVALFAGADTILGSGGNDWLNGFAGKDMLNGRAGDDKIEGGAGADRLIGGIGADHLDGDAGNDVFIGGAGADTFHGGAASDDDIVQDFDTKGADHDWIQNETLFPVTWAQSGKDILVTFGSGDTMLLVNVRPSQFSDDFILT